MDGELRFRRGGLDQDAMKRQFARVLADITSGGFARRFQEELVSGSPTREHIDQMIAGDDPLTRAERSVRGVPQAS
ncbi:MAG: hypothetical protein ACRDYZ_03990 [Acidimicrobiales bacterium]